MSDFSDTPPPPYYAVIFTTKRTDVDAGYAAMAAKMDAMAADMPGYIGIESVRNQGGPGITVSYWESEDAIRAWRTKAEHVAAQDLGKSRWYERYILRVAKVERQYEGPAGR